VPINHNIFENHYLITTHFTQLKHMIENISSVEHPLDTIREYEITGIYMITILVKVIKTQLQLQL